MAPPQLIRGGVPLTSVRGLTSTQIRTLNDLWINTAQELAGIYGGSEPTRGRLAAVLGIHRSALDPIATAAQRLIPPIHGVSFRSLDLKAAETEYGLGALLDDPEVVQQRLRDLPPYEGAIRAPLPDSHSLLGQLPPLRNQGRRSTCVAHAVLAVREQLEIAAGAPPDLDLSEQFVYWWCKEHDGLPLRSGTYLSLGMRCLAEIGAPIEALWPYVSTTGSDEGQGPPPRSAAGGDPAYRTAQTQAFNRLDIVGMKTWLVEGRAIAFTVPVFESWYKSSAMARWGKITLPLAGEPALEGHAMTLVGYQDDPHAPGGGYFLVRNSWQPWAWEGAWASGYGYLPYAYITDHANTIFGAQRIGARIR